MPALPFSPVKFSALIERVFARDKRERLCIPSPNPLNVSIRSLLHCGFVPPAVASSSHKTLSLSNAQISAAYSARRIARRGR